MFISVVTQCRLCGSRFEEGMVEREGGLTSQRVGHPLEDGNPWCLECREQLRRVEGRLLAGMALAPSRPNGSTDKEEKG
ncbi:MAG: hypothetical protein HY686_06490 [Chloroflexi bacterium]|nr:hypothetical protein [Chloroflexota bacterium]